MNPKVMTHSKNITKEKNSRGFSLGELREANINVNRANSLGIILDFRRGTVRENNVALLKDLLNKNVEAKKQRKVDAEKQTGEVKEKVKPEKVKKKTAPKKVAPKKEEVIKEIKQEAKEVKAEKAKKAPAKKSAPKKETTEKKKTEAKEVKAEKAKKAPAKKSAPKKEKAKKE